VSFVVDCVNVGLDVALDNWKGIRKKAEVNSTKACITRCETLTVDIILIIDTIIILNIVTHMSIAR
jgi:hypothetical protein